MIGSFPRTKAVREVRRKRAEAVQAESAKLTPEQRLARLDLYNFEAKKERARLKAKLATIAAEEAAEKAKKEKAENKQQKQKKGKA